MEVLFMSAISSRIQNFDAVIPLKPKTLDAVNTYIFYTPEDSAACQSVQDYAKRASTLRDLQEKLSKGEIDLSWKDKAAAIAKCVVNVLLVLAAIALPSLPFLMPFFSLPVTVLCAAGCQAGLFGGSWLLPQTFNQTLEVVQRPTLEEFREQQKDLAQFEPSLENLDRLNQIARRLETREKQLEAEWEHTIVSDSNRANRLQGECQKIHSAIQDIQKLLIAFSIDEI